MLHHQPRPAGNLDARLGLVVGKKLLKRAVDRNRVKRVVRERFRLRRGELPVMDLVVRLFSRPPALDTAAMAEDIDRLLDRLIRQAARSDLR